MNNLILVVDDDELTRMQLSELLKSAGYCVAEVDNGERSVSSI